MISTVDSSSNQFLADLSRTQAAASKAQRELSSGFKVSEAADAPDQISGLLQLEAGLGHNTQIQANLDRVKLDVDTAEHTVTQAIQLIERTTVLATEGANGIQTAASRLDLAQQVKAIHEQLVSLTQSNVDGRFIFSGDADQAVPYQLNLINPNGVDRLTQAAATRQIEDPSGGHFAASKTAQDLFDHRNPDDTFAPDNVFAAVNSLRTALENNDQPGISAAIANLRQASVYINSQQTFYGGAQNRIAAAIDSAARKDVALRTRISSLRDADLAEAILELTSAKTQLEASFSARAKLPKTSLFDYLG